MSSLEHKTKLIKDAMALTVRPDRTTDRTRKSIELTVLAAFEFGSLIVDSRHLLVGLVRERYGVAFNIVDRMGLKQDRLEQMVAGEPHTDDASLPRLDEDLALALNGCWSIAITLNHNYIGTEHVLLAIVAAPTRAHELLGQLSIDPIEVDTQIRTLLGVKA